MLHITLDRCQVKSNVVSRFRHDTYDSIRKSKKNGSLTVIRNYTKLGESGLYQTERELTMGITETEL